MRPGNVAPARSCPSAAPEPQLARLARRAGHEQAQHALVEVRREGPVQHTLGRVFRCQAAPLRGGVEQHQAEQVAADPGVVVPERVRVLRQLGNRVRVHLQQVEAQFARGLEQEVGLRVVQLGRVGPAGARGPVHQIGKAQRRIVEVGGDAHPVDGVHVTRQIVDKAPRVHIGCGKVDLRQAQALAQLLARLAGPRRAQPGQARADDLRTGAVGQHVDAGSLGIGGQQLDQAHEGVDRCRRVGDVGEVLDDRSARRPQERQHHHAPAREVAQLRGLRSRPRHGVVGTMHVDQQVPAGAGRQRLVDQREEGLRIGRAGDRILRAQRCDLLQCLQLHDRAFIGVVAGGQAMQGVPVERVVADAHMRDAHAQALAGQDGVDRLGLLDHRAAVRGIQHRHVGAECRGSRLVRRDRHRRCESSLAWASAAPATRNPPAARPAAARPASRRRGVDDAKGLGSWRDSGVDQDTPRAVR